MTVYIITRSTCDWNSILEVHYDKEFATPRRDELKKSKPYAVDGDPYLYRIEEYEVVQPPVKLFSMT